ncbi:hypothetical protein Hanom_Chr06g00495231 [Helianthus anomalus]
MFATKNHKISPPQIEQNQQPNKTENFQTIYIPISSSISAYVHQLRRQPTTE